MTVHNPLHDPIHNPSQKKPCRKRRGYLMLEALIAGGIAATVLVGVVSATTQLRLRSVRASKRSLAASLATKRLAQAASLGFEAIDANNGIFSAADTADSRQYETGSAYTVATLAACAPTSQTIGGINLTINACNVSVTVTFRHRGQTETRTDSLSLYDPS